MVNHTSNLSIPEDYKCCGRGEECVHPDGPVLPKSEFNKCKRLKDGLQNKCRACQSYYHYRNHEKNLLRMHLQRLKNREQFNAARRQRYHYDPEYRALSQERNRQSARKHSKRAVERVRIHRLINGRHRSEKERARDKERARERWQRERETRNAFRRSPKGHARAKLNRILKPEVYAAAKGRRRAREYALPQQWNPSDVKRMLDYWNNRCCICGREPSPEYHLAQDHWIAISDPRPNNPGTVPWNMLPLCHASSGGTEGCNNLKSSKDPIRWLNERYDFKKATEILVRIEAYFAWAKEQS